MINAQRWLVVIAGIVIPIILMTLAFAL